MTDDFIVFASEAMNPMPYEVRRVYYEKLSNYRETKDNRKFLDLFEYTIQEIPGFTEDFKKYLTYLYTK